MKKVGLIAAVLLAAVAAAASADYLSVDLSGAGGEGFASLVTDTTSVSYAILTSGVGTPTGAEIRQAGATVLNLGAMFDFGAATGSASGKRRCQRVSRIGRTTRTAMPRQPWPPTASASTRRLAAAGSWPST